MERSVEHTILTLLHSIYSHLEQSKAYVETLFVDLSSAFNFIQPRVLSGKLRGMNVNPYLTLWINNLLTRSQSVRLMHSLSDVVYINTRAPQGCVLSPLLFILYQVISEVITPHVLWQSMQMTLHLTGCITHQDETGYRNEIVKFVDWCRNNFLVLNSQNLIK